MGEGKVRRAYLWASAMEWRQSGLHLDSLVVAIVLHLKLGGWA
jgi:hypothetical protein